VSAAATHSVRADDAKRRTDRVISGCAGEIHDWREEIKKKVSTLP
jgi:hypothetical protein